MFVPCDQGEKHDLEDYTLILPAVAIGNVGQLTVDLLIHNLNFIKIGYLYDSCILPVVGNDPFNHSSVGSLSTSTEVFECAENKLIVIQQRSPIAKGMKHVYCTKIIEWIKENRFQQIVLLTSCLASERLDSQIQSGPFRFVLSPTAKHLRDTFHQQLGWKSLEKRPDESKDANDIFLPGGGVSKLLYQTCCQKEVALTMLLVFCAEGDNIPDALLLLKHVNDWLKLKQKNTNYETSRKETWQQPPSWKNLYGTKHISSIF